MTCSEPDRVGHLIRLHYSPIRDPLHPRSRPPVRPDPLRRDLELLRLADGHGRHLATGLARACRACLHPGRVLTAGAVGESRGLVGGTGVPADSRGASHRAGFVEAYFNDRCERIVEAVVAAAGTPRRDSVDAHPRGALTSGPSRCSGQYLPDTSSVFTPNVVWLIGPIRDDPRLS